MNRKLVLVLSAGCAMLVASMGGACSRAQNSDNQPSLNTPAASGTVSNPNVSADKNSQQPFWTQLRLVRCVRQPFRLLFASYDGSPAHLKEMYFQINTLDVIQPPQFVHIGDVIGGTKFKVIKFQAKSLTGPKIENDDVSELTLQNTESGNKAALVLSQVANSPELFAKFRYLWNNTEFSIKKGQGFTLPPDNSHYLLIDVTDVNAVIQTPDGKLFTVPKLGTK